MNLETLQSVMRRAPTIWLQAVIDVLDGTEIDTPNEIASFIAEIAHESAEFTQLQENLNYSAERLMAVWPSRFKTLEYARRYARNPERLANLVYANRLGNGPEESGDGWRYRGRGPIQLTGKDNYARCGAALALPLVEQPDMLFEPPTGIRSALWFWQVRGLDAVDDDEDLRAETQAINGGEIGLMARQDYFDKIRAAL